ncbi:flagellar hook-basal body protein [Desulfofundulus thermocisternus]|uniref:flagellar hook-basal body protein n=1 Tax=Desulfofundulus thermocisternus TaxID=42471 RepID=UPI00048757A0|nr:flagellar hook basal-body protein [Desulfofundulus thermocisternus]
MIQAIYSSLSGMLNHRMRMDTISNNISNSNTTGFKTSIATFQDALYQTMRAGTAQNNPLQIGAGVTLASVITNFAQGPLQATGRPLDLAINGNGFFGLKREGDDTIYYTREGTFYLDKDGYLVNPNGLRLVQEDEKEIKIDTSKLIDSIRITNDGEINVKYGDGSEGDKPVIGLFSFVNPNGLTKIGGNLYVYGEDTQDNPAGQRTQGRPGKDGFGTIESGSLEMANIDMAYELVNLIMTQLGYEANAKVFITSDEVLKETIDLKR